MVGNKHATMADRRALLTDREREIILDEADVSDSYRYQTISRVRSRFDRLEGDLDVLKAHGELLTELREIVCDNVEDIAGIDSSDEVTDTEAKEEIYRDLEHQAEEPVGLDALVDEIVDEGVLSGSGEKLEKRRAALHAAVEYLREERKAEPKDFKQNVYPDHQAGYTDGEDPPNSWWKNCIYKGLRELAERSDEIEVPDYSGEWVYRGGNA
jgi:hypothetical protein